jgi:hypothetical protein
MLDKPFSPLYSVYTSNRQEAGMDRTQERFERFAQLRAAYPDSEYEDIMSRIHDEEVEQSERDLLERLDAEDEERERLLECAAEGLA